MPQDSHHCWNVARQQGSIVDDGLLLFRLGASGHVEERHLRGAELERIEVVTAPSLPSEPVTDLGLVAYLKGGLQLELLTSVRLGDLREARAIAAGLERLLRGREEWTPLTRYRARTLLPARPWRPPRLHLTEDPERFRARWGYLFQTEVEADSEQLWVRRFGHPPLHLDSDDLLSLQIETEVEREAILGFQGSGAERVRYHLVADLRRARCLRLLPHFPDPVFAAFVAREASRRLGLLATSVGRGASDATR